MIIPSVILWLCAFLTLLLDVNDLTNRNRTSVTALLVLVTLFGSISNKDDFPKTSGVKYIDIWFLWYLTNIFVIICLHVAIYNVSRIFSHEYQSSANVLPLHSMDEKSENTSIAMIAKKKQLINFKMFFFLLLLMVLFNISYFTLTTYFES